MEELKQGPLWLGPPACPQCCFSLHPQGLVPSTPLLLVQHLRPYASPLSLDPCLAISTTAVLTLKRSTQCAGSPDHTWCLVPFPKLPGHRTEHDSREKPSSRGPPQPHHSSCRWSHHFSYSSRINSHPHAHCPVLPSSGRFCLLPRTLTCCAGGTPSSLLPMSLLPCTLHNSYTLCLHSSSSSGLTCVLCCHPPE